MEFDLFLDNTFIRMRIGRITVRFLYYTSGPKYTHYWLLHIMRSKNETS